MLLQNGRICNMKQVCIFDDHREQHVDSEMPFGTLNGHVMGVDEVGRGPLIGNVVTAAVVLPEGCSLALTDSKKLSDKKRNELYPQIIEQSLAYAIGEATPEEIDQLNILQATMLAMTRAIDSVLKQLNDVTGIYIDGNRCPNYNFPMKAVVKGDMKIAEVSAASILAKVTRDNQMIELAKKYPKYGFDQHKGYPSPSHLKALEEFGLIPGYRRSFKPVRKLLTE
jgi:ribonuclease HII